MADNNMAVNENEQMECNRETMKLYTVDEAAKRLGIASRTLRMWVYRRSVPYMKVGRCVRFTENQIASMITTMEVKA